MSSVASSDSPFHATAVYSPQAPTDRQFYRETVTSVADRAKAVMDAALHARIDKALAMVLAGDIELLPDGKAQVASQTNGTTQYFVVNGVCPCKDCPKAPQHFCKHRLAFGIAKRTAQAIALAEERFAAEDAPSAETPPDTALLTPYIVHIHGLGE